jgi:hypothetical protein
MAGIKANPRSGSVPARVEVASLRTPVTKRAEESADLSKGPFSHRKDEESLIACAVRIRIDNQQIP